MCGNNHWIITPNLTRSIQIDSWPGGLKSYLWQPVTASPVIQLRRTRPGPGQVRRNYPVIIATHHHSLTLGISVIIPIQPKSAQSHLRLLPKLYDMYSDRIDDLCSVPVVYTYI